MPLMKKKKKKTPKTPQTHQGKGVHDTEEPEGVRSAVVSDLGMLITLTDNRGAMCPVSSKFPFQMGKNTAFWIISLNITDDTQYDSF